MKVALIYDRVNKIGGAERVLMALGKLFPEAPLYTAVYNPETAPWARDFKVIPSFLQKFPWAKTKHEFYPWLTPLAFESFSFEEYDAVISVTSAEAKGIITKPKTFHLCYCLTPTRYLWGGFQEYQVPVFAKPIVSYLKKWDLVSCQRPDSYLAISKNVQRRIKKYYARDSEVVYPPVETNKFKIRQSLFARKLAQSKQGKTTSQNSKFFLVVSRLVAYKRVDLAIEVFNELGWPLKIVGAGSEEERLKGLAASNVEFLGQLTDEQLLGYYQRCRAVIFPQEEDFGLVPLEAQSCGKPVIAYQAGGALETVEAGKTGEFFQPQTSKALKKVIKDFRPEKYRPGDCRTNAEKFSQEIFEKNFRRAFEKKWEDYQKTVFS